MARLFVTQREIDFIADICREIIHDVNGQNIIVYPISALKTLTHDLYDEAVKKIYDQPISVGAFVNASTQQPTAINEFGVDRDFKLEIYVHYRDLVDRGIELALGDYFTFSDVLYEITECRDTRNVFGQAEYTDGVYIVGTRARVGALDLLKVGPTDISYTDADAVQETFRQQRGFAEDVDGETGSRHALIERGVLELPSDGPREVSLRGGGDGKNAFYDE